jgi:hypothetical protein
MTVPAEMVTVGSIAACAANAKARRGKRVESIANRDVAIVEKDEIKVLGADVTLLS